MPARRAWKSRKLEHELTSSHSPQPGAQTSTSYFMAAWKARSPVHIWTTRCARPEPAADRLRVVEQRQQLRIRRLGPHELHHLDLVELVTALDAADVAPGGHLLAPEARRVGDVADRERLRGSRISSR